MKIKKTYSRLSLNSIYSKSMSLNVMSLNHRACHCFEKGQDFIAYCTCLLFLVTRKIPFVILKMGNKSLNCNLKIFSINLVLITSLKTSLTFKYCSECNSNMPNKKMRVKSSSAYSGTYILF